MVVLSLFSLLLTRKKKVVRCKKRYYKGNGCELLFIFPVQRRYQIRPSPPPHGPLSRCADWSEELSVVVAVSAANATQPGGLLMVLTV